jgi:hypothetical protein
MSEKDSPSPSDPQDPAEKPKSSPVKKSADGDAPAPMPIRPRQKVTRQKDTEEPAKEEKETPKEKEPAQEKEPAKEKEPEKARLKPSGKPFRPHTPVREPKETPAAVETPLEDEAEDEVDAPATESEPQTQPTRSSERHRKPSSFARLLRLKLPFVPLMVVFLIALISLGFWAHGKGVTEGRRLAEKEAQKPFPEIPVETMARLDKATESLRSGGAAEALTVLSELESTTAIPSLSYLVALAALQNGDVDLVEEKAKLSIKKREKISDSLALLAVVESQRGSDKTRVKMGNSVRRAEDFLTQAIAADPSNPYPRFELATLLRYDKRREEAAKELKGARSLLNPIDSHSIMDITTRVMEVEQLPQEQVVKMTEVSDNPQKLIPGAYAAMRVGDFEQAAQLLRIARDVMTFESFDYLINDPAFRRFAREPQLAEFYQ